MLYLQQLILFAFSLLLLCSATKHRQRAQHTAAESEGFLNAPIPRMWDESSPPVSDTSSESPLAAIKRTLLGARQSSCDPGYALCDGESLYSQPAEDQARDRTNSWWKPPKDAALTAATENAATMEPA